jgi:hypothetical protein
VCSRSYLNVVATALLSYASSLAAAEAPPPDQYETPGPVNAEDFLPKSAFSGKEVFVEKTAQNDGLQNTYQIRAGTEEYEITGCAGAVEFLQELKAIDELRQISTTKAFTQGVKESAKGTYQTGKQIVQDPVGTAKKIPQGASKFFAKVKRFFNDDEEGATPASSPGDTVKELLGVDKAKRKLAARLGVDVYSRNQALQDELDRLASATAGGGLAFDIGTLPIGGAVGIGLTVIGIQEAVDSLVNDSTPNSLRNWNEQNLIKLGANPDLVFQFINHPWYTLRQITVITASLTTTKVDPDLFLQSANLALTPADGRYFERVAELLEVYSQKTAPLQAFRLQDGLLCAVDTNGVLVVPVSLDYVIWTEKVAQRVDGLAGGQGTVSNIKSVEVYTDGKASDRMKAELSKRGIGYQNIPLTEAG